MINFTWILPLGGMDGGRMSLFSKCGAHSVFGGASASLHLCSQEQ
jgi:hypothetical protein